MSKKELRKFGLVLAGLIALFFGAIIPWIWGARFPLWPWVSAATLTLIAFALPAWLAPIYKAWTFVGHLLGFINTRIILGVIFYLVVTPFGFFKRMRGYDPMSRIGDKEASSYRKPVEYREPKHMEDSF